MQCEDIDLVTKVKDEVDEASEEVEDRRYAINVNNQNTMHENVHFHLRHVCIVMH
jgi:hypothetical protein